MPNDELIVLACSRKTGGLCIAGIEPRTGRWIRPVSGVGNGELYPQHCDVNGRPPQLLEIVQFDHTGPTGDPAQPENVRIAQSQWSLTGVVPAASAYHTLASTLVSGPTLLGDTEVSIDDTVAQQGIPASLALIAPEDLEFRLAARGPYPASPRASFHLDGCDYDLPITDRQVRPALQRAGVGTHDLVQLGFPAATRVLLTISLGEPINPGQARWKLIAAIVQLP